MVTMRISCILFLVIFLGAGCRDSRVFTMADSWFVPSQTYYLDAPTIDQSRIHEVRQSEEAAAESLLRDVSWIEVSGDRAKRMCGSIPSEGRRIVLVRAVKLADAAGGFGVRMSAAGDLFIGFHCMGGHPLPMRRAALVLELDRLPARVFNSCSMTE
jgi:hypothetical protein